MKKAAKTTNPSSVLVLLVAIVLVGVAATSLATAGRTRYAYDALGRLVRVGQPDGTTTVFTYDPAGNLINETVIPDADFDGIADDADPCTDTDGDAYGDPGFPANTCPADNCPLISNADQADADGDGSGDACDACTDTDGDAYGDPGYPANTCTLDNCGSVFNPLQLDTDSDLVGDACDCAPFDAGNATPLGPVATLRFTSDSNLAWDPPVDDGGGSLVYDLLRSEDPTDWFTATCLEATTTATTATDTDPPSDSFFYLVRVRSTCGENLGTRSPEERREGVTCDASPKTVFQTSTTSIGNLGGLAGADAICQNRAAAAGLAGMFKAWLSDGTASAAERLHHATGPYVRVDGVTVADDWSDLVDGSLQNPINVDEFGVTAPVSLVWTGTYPDGSADTSYHCTNWTQPSGMGGGNGQNNLPTGWTYTGAVHCAASLPLYCMEQ